MYFLIGAFQLLQCAILPRKFLLALALAALTMRVCTKVTTRNWREASFDVIVDDTYQVDYLNSQVIHDFADKDMSGAVNFATRRASSPMGPQVNFAAAWGQESDRSGNSDESALDLGTQVVPFTGFQASKIVSQVDENDNDGQISPGGKIRYTIIASNVGQQDIPTGGVTIQDALDPDVSYVANSMSYDVPETGDSAPISGSSFPLAGNGLPGQFPFLKRGGTHEISFEVIINGDDSMLHGKGTINNEGTVTFGIASVPFQLKCRMFEALINIEKKIYMGSGTVNVTAAEEAECLCLSVIKKERPDCLVWRCTTRESKFTIFVYNS